ncbi:MAG: DUF167 family protein [Elusimicrobiales bacterium]|nr:DUF167 family protein [Elusimicrobiales bacterium]
MTQSRYVKVKVHAGCKTAKTVRRAQNSFEVWVKAEAERGQANAAMLSVVARELEIEAKTMRIIKGAHSPAKIIEMIRHGD